MTWKSYISAFLLFGGLGRAYGEPLTLTKGGQALCEIVLPAGASSVERYAARELQEAIGRATGARPEVVQNSSAEQGRPRLILGTPKNTPEIANLKTLESTDSDEIFISINGATIFLGGSNPRSVLYAVYRFLEETMSFRWLWPGEGGEFFQKTDNCVVDGLELHEKAAIQFRSLAINAPHYDEDTVIWMARNRMNVFSVSENSTPAQFDNLHEKGFLIRFAGHNLKLPLETLEKHPEYVAEYGGKRVLIPGVESHLCWSNPAVQEELTKLIQTWIKKYPQVDLWGFYPADQTHFCECAQCVAMAKDVSTRFQKLSAILIDNVRKTTPETHFATLAYQAYRDVPKTVAPFDTIQYAAYNISYRHPLKSGGAANEPAIREIAAWQKLGVPMGFRGYEMIPFERGLFLPLVTYEIDQLQFLKENDLRFFSTEVTPFGYPHGTPPQNRNWDTNRLNLYTVGHAMWSKEASATDLVGDWTRTIYGAKAAEPMARYYFAMEKAWINAPGEISYFQNPAALFVRGFISPELIKSAQSDFAEARAALRETADAALRQRALTQIALEEKMFEAWKVLSQLVDAESDQLNKIAVKSEASPEALMNPLSDCWDQAPQLSPFLEKNGGSPRDQTQVSALWRDQTLYLRLACQDSKPGQRVARFRNRDEDVWADDSVEIFLNHKGGDGYYHLATNSLGARYDADSKGVMNLDKAFNPDWSVAVKTEKNDWLLVIALPLPEFGYSARDGENVDLSIKRTRPGKNQDSPDSGWPNAAYHSPVSHGTIRLLEKAPPRLLLYSGDRPSEVLEAGFRKKGWEVELLGKEKIQAPRKDDVVFLRYTGGNNFSLPFSYLHEVLLPWLENGGTLVVAASSAVPFKQWFGRNDMELRWSGWDVDSVRRSVEITDGNWTHIPNDLTKVLQKQVTPSSGFYPVGAGWETLATLPLKNQEAVAYLLRMGVGHGTLFLTSSNMGFGGGYEMFGDRRPENAVNLIENLSESTAQPTPKTQ